MYASSVSAIAMGIDVRKEVDMCLNNIPGLIEYGEDGFAFDSIISKRAVVPKG